MKREMKEKKGSLNFDDMLETQKNRQVQADGSVLYGAVPEYHIYEKEYWQDKRSTLQKVVNALNPRNQYRGISRWVLRWTNEDLYKLLFPVSVVAEWFKHLFGDSESRRDALYQFFSSTFFEILMLIALGAAMAGVVVLFR